MNSEMFSSLIVELFVLERSNFFVIAGTYNVIILNFTVAFRADFLIRENSIYSEKDKLLL